MALTTIEQGLSFVQYEADGTTPNFPLTFEYLQQSDVKVFVGNTEVFYTWLNAATVTPNDLPISGDIVTVRRFTTNTERLVDFQDGGQISERDLDKNSDQLFFLTQESNDTAAFNLTTDPLLQVVDFRGNRGINLAAPVDPTDAINKQYIDDIESDVAAAVTTANTASATADSASAAANAIADVAAAAEEKVDLHLTDDTAHNASAIVNVPAGEVSAITVQAAIDELDTEKQSRSEKGQINGYAELDSNGKVPAGQLPSFVDDVLEFTDLATFPVTGEAGKIYVAIDTSKAYRWSGTVYTEISPSEVNSVNGQTGTVVLAKADVGLDQVDNTSDATKNAAVANLTNKALISPSRLDPKKDTLANLLDYASLTGMNGELVYSTDTKEFFVITDNELVAAGGGGGDSDSLLINPDFEGREEEWSCVNATGALVATTLPSANSEKMFQMTATLAGGYCDFIAPTGATAEGLLFKIGGLFQTSLTGVEYCTLVNGVVDNCIPIDASTKFTQPVATQSQSGATSAGIRIRSTTTTGVVNADKLKLNIGGLPTGPTISCNGDLDCENEFSASVAGFSSPSTVSNLSTQGWVSDCVRTTAGASTVYTCPISNDLNLTTRLNCSAIVTEVGLRLVTYDLASTTSEIIFKSQNSATNVAQPNSFDVICQKSAPDYKTITQQGVVNVGNASSGLLQRFTAGTQSVSGTVTLDFSTEFSVPDELVTWDDTDNEGTVLKAGKYSIEASINARSGGTNSGFQSWVEVDNGSGFTEVLGSRKQDFSAGGGNRLHLDPKVIMRLKAGDKVRIRAVNSSGSAVTISEYANIQIRSVVDQQAMALSMQGVSRIEGEDNKKFVEGWATFGGASESSICNASPCVRYGAVGDVGRNLSATRVSTGRYRVISGGWQQGAYISCYATRWSGLTQALTIDYVNDDLAFFADVNGEVTFEPITRVVSTSTFTDSTIQIYCKGQAPL